MKTLYILGAGASAGKSRTSEQCIPTVAEFPKSISKILNHSTRKVRNKEPKLSKETYQALLQFSEGCIEFGTPDTYAKSIFLSKGEGKEYQQVKMMISFIVKISQLMNGVDPRYFQFFSALLDYEKPNVGHLNDDIYLATWNYDLQINEALIRLLSVAPHDLLDSNIYFHGLRYTDYVGKIPKQKIFRINGYAGSINNDLHGDFDSELNLFYDHSIDKNTKINSEILAFENNFKKKENITQNIKFAWDSFNKQNKEIESLKLIANQISCLVIIGYSFPIYNRIIDMEILRSFTNLEKVYLQDYVDHSYKIKTYFRDLGMLHTLVSGHTEYVSGCDQFLVPSELYL
ncbi:hypothetical protein [Leptospira perdikensis]|uniref:SIR2-like domain-containing protein n=1 Tax=Leptospira perdikensis TaxID=2484948 RepID=A0A4R9J9P7_9LEPT|nr:hypothetical protein [Leptospira perdikensis]TGL35593.1 hypothetical protein EHQ49_17610 [Leptospira perdikensis]